MAQRIGLGLPKFNNASDKYAKGAAKYLSKKFRQAHNQMMLSSPIYLAGAAAWLYMNKEHAIPDAKPVEKDATKDCITFYRGDRKGLNEFWAPMIRDGGYYSSDAEELIRTERFQDLAFEHMQDSGNSPFISITTNYMTAEAYASQSNGQVYTISLPSGVAIHNIMNAASIRHPNGLQYPDDEWLVPIHIPSQFIDSGGCGCD
mgnify:FL=1